MENEDNLVNRKQVMRNKLKWTKDQQIDRQTHTPGTSTCIHFDDSAKLSLR